jgi:ankyrin repeat protein
MASTSMMGEPAWVLPIRRNDAKSVRALLEKGEVPLKDKWGGRSWTTTWTPLAWALLHKAGAVVEVLIEFGADLNAPCREWDNGDKVSL